MMYLHDPCVLFLHTRKCAGTSFEIALSHFAGPDDIITLYANPDQEQERFDLAGRGAQNYGFRRGQVVPENAALKSAKLGHIPEKFRNHMTAAEACDTLGEVRWNDAQCISIIRNPFDMAVSFYFWRMSLTEKNVPFDQWCQAKIGVMASNRDIYSIDGQIAVQHLLRFETIGEDIAALERAIPDLTGLGEIFGRTRAKSGVRPADASAVKMFADYPEAKPVIEEAFAEEIDRFGYSLG